MKNLKTFLILTSILLLPVPVLGQVPASAPLYCPQLSQNMVRGSRGGQVLELQKFLSWYYNISPATIQTGYFGPITQSYIIKFQEQKGLPPVGRIGPITRNEIVKVCQDFTPPVNFSANQTVGLAPLNVTFITDYDGIVELGVSFGDGTPGYGAMRDPICAQSYGVPCPSGRYTSHVYTQPGIYTAQLVGLSSKVPCNELHCPLAPAIIPVWAQITITVL